ncbi:MAG: LysR family transcriptional regulator, partial [Comamonadaceae bacterium]|nr:LysR family transcriptional regulator [Comamonadaceae bacterium]
MDLPLNALRAFEVSARHLSFTRAAQELNLTQAAVSQHVKNLEQRLGTPLFRRVPRGLALTDEGQALLPVLMESFERMAATLATFKGSQKREVLSVGVVGTFAVGWLLPNLKDFQLRHPFIELRLFTNNNRVDLAGEGLDCAIRFGDGHWHGTEAMPLLRAP